ncbi:helix-turn-helix domain-containing protein [Aeromonas caviae]|uniref:helix-turn-helix domain-containing protein n=1 Tax=Gammaproteobacteria TaxID=1236 RepID=UPI000F7A6269|nr:MULTISPECIES: helix-turn-helix domain-containing protein [Gammaproteobacteria]MDH0436171.1 helix-turn-helix domain-containing protein [Aeromonas caviae]MDH0939017.1 helix-turn-helix domain-containing protein [Aeromonas caviae]MDH1399850.1 helix-turn-helix domain-containing protein [Aeromonas caviae]MDH1849077.1 helix-turn-helix domain-containing protein [Aeromonas caviae]RRY22714.1 helix-turn-helix domain-containing protein [Pseudomonas aeruginosa]
MKITNAKQLSAYLRDVRLSADLSQGKVASKVGIRQDTVSSFELQPGTTKLETFFKILSALDLELEVKPKGSDPQSPDGWKEEW